MAKKFKDYYDRAYLELLAEKLTPACPEFESEGFIDALNTSLETLEFHQRQDLIAEGITRFIPRPYPEILNVFTKILGSELHTDTGMFTQGWWLWPIGRYVQINCLQDPEISYRFIYELTKRFTGEFAIRPLVQNQTQQTLEIMKTWSTDANVHVRRLASEGLRTRLPWAGKQTAVLAYPNDLKEILTNLNNAPEKFVQKSVGNNLNDLYKDAPELAQEIIDSWEASNPTKITQWIIKHGKRNLGNNLRKQK